MHLRQPVGAERIRSSSTSFALQTRSSWPSRTLHRRSMPWSIARRIRSSSWVSAARIRTKASPFALRKRWPPRGSRSGAPRSPVRTSPPSARGPRRSAARAPVIATRSISNRCSSSWASRGAVSACGAPARSRVRARARGHAPPTPRASGPERLCVRCRGPLGRGVRLDDVVGLPGGGDDRGRRCRDLDSWPATRTVDPVPRALGPVFDGLDDLGAVHLDLDRLPHVRARTFLTARP